MLPHAHRQLQKRSIGYASVLSLLLMTLLCASSASAHGKEVQITLASWSPDPQQALMRLYEASVTYVGDAEPVEGARLAFTASRQEDNSSVGDVAFAPVPNNPGEYVAQIRYPRFGTWDITLRSVVPGEGEATTTEQITPGAPATAGTRAAAAAANPQPRNLCIVFQFDWHDVLNIAVRTTHSLGAAAYLGLTGVLLLNIWFESYLARSTLWRRLTRAAFPGALASLGLIVASGVLTGYVDAPVRAPGVFNIEALANVPYGFAYMAAFWLKLVLGLGVLVVVSKARPTGLRLSEAGAATLLAGRLTVSFGLLVALLLVNVVVLVYLHNLSHLSASLPAR